MTKASVQQAKFINRILSLGGYQVPGTKVFPKNEIRSMREYKIVTIKSCRAREWVLREETPDGGTLWTVTIAGRDAANPPLPISEKTEKFLNDLEREHAEGAA